MIKASLKNYEYLRDVECKYDITELPKLDDIILQHESALEILKQYNNDNI